MKETADIMSAASKWPRQDGQGYVP